MAQIDDPRILLLMGFNQLTRPITAGIVHHDDVVNEVRDRLKDPSDQSFFVVSRNNDSNGFVSVHKKAAPEL
jgi:hypothetical protein